MRLPTVAVNAFEYYIGSQITADQAAERPEGAKLLRLGRGGFLEIGQLLVSWTAGNRAVQAKYLSGTRGNSLVIDTRREISEDPLDVCQPETSYTAYSFISDLTDNLLVATEAANGTKYPQALATALDCGPFVRYALPTNIENARPGTEAVGLDEFLLLGKMLGAYSLLGELNAV